MLSRRADTRRNVEKLDQVFKTLKEVGKAMSSYTHSGGLQIVLGVLRSMK